MGLQYQHITMEEEKAVRSGRGSKGGAQRDGPQGEFRLCLSDFIRKEDTM